MRRALFQGEIWSEDLKEVREQTTLDVQEMTILGRENREGQALSQECLSISRNIRKPVWLQQILGTSEWP